MDIFSKVHKAIKEGGAGLLFKRALDKARMSVTRYSLSDLFFHPMLRGLPKVHLVFHEAQPTSEDEKIAERIMKAYRKAVEDEKKHKDPATRDLWDSIQETLTSDFFAVVKENNIEKIAEYLRNMHNRGLTYGYSDIPKRYYDTHGNSWLRRKFRDQHIALFKDQMVSLGEALGVISFQNERGNLYIDGDVLADKIERKLGIDIKPPAVDAGSAKIKMGGGYYSARDIFSIYYGFRIKQILGNSTGAICEIGGGSGKIAVYAKRFGFSDYSLFDLPTTNVAQAWQLIKNGLDVVLYGEEDKTDAVKILPYWAFTPEKKYALAINADSFPEIGGEIVRDYLNTIKQCADMLLSVNQEFESEYSGGRHIVVYEEVEKVGGFTRLLRFPFWLRKGYVEELYKVIQN